MLDRDGRFIGFLAPQYTQVPDELFDELLATLSGPETKVLLYLVRRTFGFKRDSDTISLNQMMHGLKARDGRQLDRGVGLSKPTIVKALKALADKNVILTRRDRQPDGSYGPNTYALNVIRDSKATLLSQESRFASPGKHSLLPLVNPVNPQETVSDTTDEYTASQQATPADAVVASLLSSPNDLTTALQELGLKPSMSKRLLRMYDQDHIARMIEFVVYKVQTGWRPKESIPAWLVSAIREGWQAPAYFATAAEREDLRRSRQTERTEQEERAHQAQQQMMEREREELLSRLGVDQQTQKQWERAQALLRDRGQWTIALVDAHLVRRGEQVQIVVPYDFARQRIQAMSHVIHETLAEVTGSSSTVEIICDEKPFEAR